ncbi:MAG: hypothetical protein DCC55_37880 [Chloroflexi bacterium]|nr:MAG: hypothetical protein DCC55_37880 [Chloroflexota bacterium]
MKCLFAKRAHSKQKQQEHRGHREATEDAELSQKLFGEVWCVALAECDAPGLPGIPEVRRTLQVYRTSVAPPFQAVSQCSLLSVLRAFSVLSVFLL